MEADVCYCHIQHFHEKNSIYTCCVYKKDLTNIKVLFEKSSVDKGIRGIALSKCKLSAFPRELSEFFPNLDHLAINGGLREISKEDIACFPKLKFLDLQGCEISVLPNDLFTSSPNIQMAYFSFNQITSVGVNLLEPLKELKYIDFRGNSNINVVYDENKTDDLTLEELKGMIREQSDITNNFAGNTSTVRA